MSSQSEEISVLPDEQVLGRCPHCHNLSPITDYVVVKANPRKKCSTKDLDMNTLYKLSNSEIKRHIKNLRCSIRRARGEDKINLTHKLEILLHRIEIRENR